MFDNPDHYFDRKKVINFQMINHQCRGDLVTKTEKNHKTVRNDDFKNYPAYEKNKTLSAIFRNRRDDLCVKRDLMIKHFRKNF